MTPANDNRPTSFDARVMAYVPGLTKLAKHYRHKPEDQADLVTDTIIYALGAWQNFRDDGSGKGMWSWLSFCMRGVVSNGAKKADLRKGLRFVELTDAMQGRNSVEPSQQHHVELGDALRKLKRIKGGSVVVKRALGHTLRDIGERKGMSTSRVEQIANTARGQLMKAVS